MKLKKYGATLLGLLLAASMAACGTTNPETVDPTAEPTNAPASDPVVLEPTVPTDEPAMNPTDDPADAEDDPAGGQTGVPNPRTDYASAAELNAALGFTVIELDADAGYTAASFAAIDGKVGEILYRDEGGAELCLRTARASDGMDAEPTRAPRSCSGAPASMTARSCCGSPTERRRARLPRRASARRTLPMLPRASSLPADIHPPQPIGPRRICRWGRNLSKKSRYKPLRRFAHENYAGRTKKFVKSSDQYGALRCKNSVKNKVL